MARTIDERIVQMTFNNKEFEKNANQSIKTLNNLSDSLNLSNAGKGLERLQQAASRFNVSGLEKLQQTISKFDFSGIDNAVQNAKNTFTAWEVAAVTAIANVTSRAVDAAIILAKSLSIDQITSGWSKYNSMIASQQSIMSAVSGKVNELTGELYDMEAVSKRISKLQWYTDETSYSLEQMTNAIASFTSSGIDLDVATNAIIGISNACADSGVSIEKAEHAFTGFAKAIGSGEMSLSVWNNQLKTSGIINSERFKQSLIDSAVALGTLKKDFNDAVYGFKENGEKFDVTVANIGDNFKEGHWATAQVMIDALTSYSDTVDEIYDMATNGEFDTASAAIEDLTKQYKKAGKEIPKSLAAFTRAQEAITLGQAIQSVKDAVSSKWSQTFEYIFGDYEEAKRLWTTLANNMWEWFASTGELRNDILKNWHNGFSQFEIADGIEEDVRKSVKAIETLDKKIEELTKSNKVINFIKAEEEELQLYTAIITQRSDDIGKVITESETLIENYLQAELPSALYDEIVSIKEERDKILEGLDNEIEKDEIILEYNKKIGDIFKKSQTYYGFYDDAKKVKGLLDTKNLETYKKYQEALESGDKDAISKMWSDKDTYKILSEVPEIYESLEQYFLEIEKINKDESKTWKEKSDIISQLYDLITEESLSSFEVLNKLNSEKVIVNDFLDAISNNDAKKSTEMFAENFAVIEEYLGKDNIPDSITNIRTSIEKLTEVDGISNKLKSLNEQIEDLEKNGKNANEVTKLKDTYEDLKNAIISEDSDTIFDILKKNSSVVQDVFNDNNVIKDILTEISNIEKDSLLTSEQKAFKIGLAKNSLLELVKVFSNVDDIETEQLKLEEEINSYFIERNSGYIKFIDGIKTGLESITAIIERIRKAWSNVFGSVKATWLVDLTDDFKTFMESISPTEERLEEIQNKFTNIFAVLKNIANVFSLIGKVGKAIYNDLIEPIANEFKPILADLYKIFEDLGQLIFNKTEEGKKNISSFVGLLHNVFTTLKPIIDLIKDGVGEIRDFVSSLLESGESTDEANEKLFTFSSISEKIVKVLQLIVDAVKNIINVLDLMIDVGKTIYDSLIKPIINEIKPIFSDLYGIIQDIGQLIFNKTEEGKKNISTFAGVLNNIFTILKPIIDLIKLGVGVIHDFTSSLVESGESADDATNKFSIFSAIARVIIKVFNTAADVVENFSGILDLVIVFLSKLFDKAKEILGEIKNILVTPMGNSSMNPLSLLGLILAAKEGFDFKWNVVDVATSIVDTIKNVVKVIGETFDEIAGAVESFSMSNFGKAFESMSKGLLMMAAAIFIIASIKDDEIEKSIWAITRLSLLFAGLVKLFQMIASSNTIITKTSDTKNSLLGLITGKRTKAVTSNKTTMANLIGLSTAIDQFAFALLVLAGSLKLVSTIPLEQMLPSVGAILILMYGMVKVVQSMTKLSASAKDTVAMATITKMVKSIALAMIELAIALKIIGSLSWPQIGVALVGVIGSLGSIMLFIFGLNKLTKGMRDTKLATIGAIMTEFGLAMIELSIALKIMSTIDWDQMKVALGGLLISLITIFAFLTATSKSADEKALLAIGGSLLMIAPAILLIAGAIALLGQLQFGTILKGVFAIAAFLAVFSYLSIAVGNSQYGMAAMPIMAVSLLIMAKALEYFAIAIGTLTISLVELGSLGWDIFKPGLQILAALLGIITGFSLVLGVLSPLLLLAGAGMILFGKGLEAAGKGLSTIFLAVAALDALGENGILKALMSISSMISAAIVNILAAIIELIPLLIMGVCQGIINSASEILNTIRLLIDLVVEALGTMLYPIISLVAEFITLVGEAIAERSDRLVEAGMTILEAILKGVRDHMDDIFTLVEEIVNKFLECLNGLIDSILNGLWVFLITLINNLAELIRTRVTELGGAFGNLASAIIEGLIGGLIGGLSTFASRLGEFGSGIIQKIKDFFSGNESEDSNKEVGSNIVESLSDGIEEKREEMLTKVETMSQDVTDTMDREEEATTSGKNTIQGLIDGLNDSGLIDKVKEAGISAAKKFKESYDAEMDEHSPSKEMQKRGKFAIQGLVMGLNKNMDDIEKSGKSIGKTVLSSVEKAIEIASSIPENLNPVITPVLDLSEIQNGASKLSGMLNTSDISAKVSSLGGAFFGNNNRLAGAGEINVSLNNTFDIKNGQNIDRSTVSSWSNWIFEDINEKLGQMTR